MRLTRDGLTAPGNRRFGKGYRGLPRNRVEKTDPNAYLRGQIATRWVFESWDDYVEQRPHFTAALMFLSGAWADPDAIGGKVGLFYEGGIARASSSTHFTEGPTTASIDLDRKSETETYGQTFIGDREIDTPEAFHAALIDVVPELDGVAMLIYASSSGNIRFPDGTLYKGATNFRADVLVASGAMAPALMNLIHQRCFARRICASAFVSRSDLGRPSVLTRSLSDQALKTACQPDFAAPHLSGGLTQDRMWTSFGQRPLDAVPALTEAEIDASTETQNELRAALEGQRQEVETRNFKGAVSAKVKRGMTRKDAVAATKRRFEDGVLSNDDLIYDERGMSVELGAFAKGWQRGMPTIAIPCPDRGPDYGMTTASVLWSAEFDSPTILTHASGGKRFRLVDFEAKSAAARSKAERAAVADFRALGGRKVSVAVEASGRVLAGRGKRWERLRAGMGERSTTTWNDVATAAARVGVARGAIPEADEAEAWADVATRRKDKRGRGFGPVWLKRTDNSPVAEPKMEFPECTMAHH